ncbi:hypothetical protein [Geoalkalibacter subterraneus]|uniref:Uncharacterized protein n=1 Tax=Geoalkalibacter subterraneus TaxID=483547 RepID=A0A0B5FVU0_9BACT|nr:hypothetical protein [Geoalkalibacter subterraneus]AJF08265.1 hypothetical protein GSUB_17460 [Geoalkalibacter subterraneus]
MRKLLVSQADFEPALDFKEYPAFVPDYLLGTYRSLKEAIAAAEIEVENRAGKYEYEAVGFNDDGEEFERHSYVDIDDAQISEWSAQQVNRVLRGALADALSVLTSSTVELEKQADAITKARRALGMVDAKVTPAETGKLSASSIIYFFKEGFDGKRKILM